MFSWHHFYSTIHDKGFSLQSDLALQSTLHYHELLSMKIHPLPFNPLTDDKILDWSKLKQIADDTSSALKMENKRHIG